MTPRMPSVFWRACLISRRKARALAALADCHEAAGDRAARVAVLTRLALEFPQSPQGAAARRELLRLQSDAVPGAR